MVLHSVSKEFALLRTHLQGASFVNRTVLAVRKSDFLWNIVAQQAGANQGEDCSNKTLKMIKY